MVDGVGLVLVFLCFGILLVVRLGLMVMVKLAITALTVT